MMDYNKMPLLEEDISENLVIPNYVKIYDIIFNLIVEGVIKAGDVVPSENKLANYWKVSRGTVRMAMRKLEEDGYINKTQGKQAVVSTHALQYKDGFQWLFNPCIENCVDTIDEIKISAQYQPCGVYVAHELGYKKPGDLMVFTSTDYFSNGRQVANTVTIFDAEFMEKFQLDMNDIENMKEFSTYGLYRMAKHAKTVFNVLNADADSYIAGINKNEPVIIVEEILVEEGDKQLSYAKHQLLGSMYRFSMERKSHM